MDEQEGRPAPAVGLYWIPLGAGGYVVRWSGKLYETLKALGERRPRLDLYHTALQIWLPDDRFVIECAAILNLRGEERGVVAGGGRDELARPIPAFPVRDPSLAGRLHPRSVPGGVGSGPGGDGRRSRAAHSRSGALRPGTRVGQGRAAHRRDVEFELGNFLASRTCWHRGRPAAAARGRPGSWLERRSRCGTAPDAARDCSRESRAARGT
jgi:hypothetical protein